MSKMYGSIASDSTSSQPLLAGTSDNNNNPSPSIRRRSSSSNRRKQISHEAQVELNVNLSPDRRSTPTSTSRGSRSSRRKMMLAERRKSSRRREMSSGRAVLANLYEKDKYTSKRSMRALSTVNELHLQSTQPPLEEENHNKKKHSMLYSMLNPRSSKPHATIFKRVISSIILIDLCTFVASTDPQWSTDYAPFFHIMEGTVSCVFLLEYMARLYSCRESTRVQRWGHAPYYLYGRFRFALTGSMLLDAFATFPFFLEFFINVSLPTLTYLRVFRLFRIGKTEGYTRAVNSVWRVIYYNREILYVALLVCLFLVLLTAVLMYYLRPNDPADAQEFQSIVATMYLSTLMLTGQGGPDGDMPWYTKCVVLLTGVFSVAMFAIPASMLTWGFEAEAERLAARARMRRVSGYVSSSGSSSSSDYDWNDNDEEEDDEWSYSSDEEYQKIIAGGGEEEEHESEDPVLKELMSLFRGADADESGTLTKKEFLELVRPALAKAAAGAGQGRGQQQHQLELTGLLAGRAGDMNVGGSQEEVDALGKRLDRLEGEVASTHAKLDRILALLEQTK